MFWFGCPINGVAFGLFVGDEDGDNVKNIKFELPSTYLYLILFCVVFVSFVTTGSQKNDEVTTLKKFGIFEPSGFSYSILKPTNPCGTNLFWYCVGTFVISITIPFTFGNAFNTPQSVILVLICAGLKYNV